MAGFTSVPNQVPHGRQKSTTQPAPSSSPATANPTHSVPLAPRPRGERAGERGRHIPNKNHRIQTTTPKPRRNQKKSVPTLPSPTKNPSLLITPRLQPGENATPQKKSIPSKARQARSLKQNLTNKNFNLCANPQKLKNLPPLYYRPTKNPSLLINPRLQPGGKRHPSKKVYPEQSEAGPFLETKPNKQKH
jgi:hypothetical protein